MHFILNFNIIAILGKRRLVRVDNPFHPFFLPNWFCFFRSMTWLFGWIQITRHLQVHFFEHIKLSYVIRYVKYLMFCSTNVCLTRRAKWAKWIISLHAMTGASSESARCLLNYYWVRVIKAGLPWIWNITSISISISTDFSWISMDISISIHRCLYPV